MYNLLEAKKSVIDFSEKLQKRNELFNNVDGSYFEPGMMEFLDKSFGFYDPEKKELQLKFEAKGTRYEGRTERLENIEIGDKVLIGRDKGNVYNSNNFIILNNRKESLGSFPAELCNALAPLYDFGYIEIRKAEVSFIEPISKRSRYAKQGILFIELLLHFRGI